VEASPELAAEQAHVERAYRRLDELRARTQELLASVLNQGRGGTFQFREERDVIVRTSLARLEQLDVGDQPLCFGRIDRVVEVEGSDTDGKAGYAEALFGERGGGRREAGNGRLPETVESFHIGRLGVSSEDQEPLVVDWRAPVAEPFYRATGRDPMGLVLRRHLAASGRRITGLEDERFRPGRSPGRAGEGPVPAGEFDDDIGGPGALLAAISSARSGHMRDIVSTIQREQDEIIRAPLAGVLVVQGGPGTGKTAVALHRAAYLLYTHRFPLERQGVLVIGPNPLFLRYIEQVLPSLGESGVTLSTVSGLVHGVEARAQEPASLARLKGDARMAKFVARAVRSRQRPLRRDVRVPFGSAVLRLTAQDSAQVVSAARRRPGTHNSRRRFVEQMLVQRLAERYLRALEVHAGRAFAESAGSQAEETAGSPDESRWSPKLELGSLSPGDGLAPGLPSSTGSNGRGNGANGNGDPSRSNGHARGHGEPPADDQGFEVSEFARQIRKVPEVAEALDRVWPRLSAEELIHDLFGARPLISLAGKGLLDAREQSSLWRERSGSLAEVRWTAADVALIDEARVLLGPRRGRPPASGSEPDEAARTYGHIVVDEAQDLSPMELRMVSRRSLSGSVTAVGDIGQATGAWAPRNWDEVTAHLPSNRPPRVAQLTVSYRTPAEVVEVAARVLRAAAPGLEPPRTVRSTGVAPQFEEARASELAVSVASVASRLVEEVSPGTTAVLGPSSLIGELAAALDAGGVESSDPRSAGLGAALSLLPVDLANGLEFDAVVVVEPSAIVEESAQGLRALYMALTRPTKRLAVVHARELPVEMRR
jgi:DNA helicase IV